MSYKSIDVRVELLSYLNDKNELEYYPRHGFPIEVFVINETTPTSVFTKENFNVTSYIYLTPTPNNPDISVTLKKLLFTGTYTVLDHFSWVYTSNNSGGWYNNTITNLNPSYVNFTSFLSCYLDIKIIHLNYFFTKYSKLISSSTVYSCFTWLERENSEMFDVKYGNLVDTRKLLLDYTASRGPLKKEFSVDVYSNYYKNYCGPITL